jgi:aryl-alcohol dehydrogenase-like predicted oxidoreductase
MFDAVTCAIPGARTEQQAHDNAAAAALAPLSPEVMSGAAAAYDELLRNVVHGRW